MELDQVKLNEAAETILTALNPTTAEVIREASLLYNRYPLWVTVAGLLNGAYESGTYYHPLLDPSWPRVFDLPDMLPMTKCGWCSESFRPRRIKQQYCSNDCGLAAQHLLSQEPAPANG